MKFIFYSFICLSIFVIFSTDLSSETFWIASLATQLIPIIILLCLLLSIILLFSKKKWMLIPPISIALIGILRFAPLIYSLGNNDDNTINTSQATIRTLSFNASFFNAKSDFSESYFDPELNQSSLLIQDWISSNQADIKCIQEFYQDNNTSLFDNIKAIAKNGEYDFYFLNKPYHQNGRLRGLITFTKFPIIDAGTIFLSDNRYNGATYTDVLVFNNDTLRIINVHLQSMELNFGKYNGLIEKTIYLTKELKKGTITRERQSRIVMDYIKISPYPVILCGDFNETPYSALYRRFNKHLVNVFEKSGKGFGFTYNGNEWLFLRIDNQFCDRDIKPVYFHTYSDFQASEHFPIEAKYSLLKKINTDITSKNTIHN